MKGWDVVRGDVLATLRRSRAASFDACLSDPPYGIGFIGLGWDADVPGVDVWTEVRRVLRPGAPVLAFGSPRLAFRLALNMHLGGLFIVDQIPWIHGGSLKKSNATLRAANEPIILARAPGSPRHLALDACRHGPRRNLTVSKCARTGYSGGWAPEGEKVYRRPRLPTNVLVDEAIAKGLPPYFFASKCHRKDRHGHPTAKPVDLTRYLARLLRGPGARRILVPFAGGGGRGPRGAGGGVDAGPRDRARGTAREVDRATDPRLRVEGR